MATETRDRIVAATAELFRRHGYAGTGLKARAFLREELTRALGEAGVPSAVTNDTLSLLDACETLRFTEGTSGPSPSELAGRARAAATELARKRKRP